MTDRGLFAGVICRRARAWRPAMLVCASLAASLCDAAEPEVDRVKAAFDAGDANHDGILVSEEFESISDDAQVARRDFRVFDFDRNDRLTWSEFRSTPGVVPLSRREAIPDPFDHLVTAAVEAVDESFKQIGVRQSGGIQERDFVNTVLGSYSPDGDQRLGSLWIQQADPNRDGQVTPVEARRFIEIHLAVRRPTGDLVRQRDGRVVDYGRFQRVDADQNGTVTRTEYLQDQEGADAEREFDALDHNLDGEITLPEFFRPDGPGWVDTVELFLAADTNFDAFLDVVEAQAAIEESQRALIPSSFGAFDEDGNGKLSLDEYRLSMLGNPIAAWEKMPRDNNDDYVMSFDEFRFGDFHAELLRLFYFHRFDTNSDGTLSRKEFPFRTQPPRNFHLLAADGSEFRRLYANDEYPHCGSPAVSPDGKTIAFDGRTGGKSLRDQRILMMSIDGTGFRDVCEGLMPTWSADGTQFACSRYEPQAGIWIINADGSNARRISDGWAAQWSPDGKTIAFTKNNGIWTYDVKSGGFREVLTAAQHDYRTIYWNMCWSPDSRRLVFKARTERGADLASIRMTGGDPDLRVHFSGDGSMEPDTSWSPDGRRIVFSMQAPDSTHRLLYELDPTRNDPPKLVEGIDRSLTYKTSCFTRDGKWLIVATMDLQGQPRNAAIDQ